MSDKLNEYIGYWVKIKCDTYFCTGEIIAIDSNTIVLTNSTINDVIVATKFLGINQTLIHGMDIINGPTDKKSTEVLHNSNTYLNVYTSSSQPPVIKRGGSSSAVHRNLSRLNNSSKEKINKSRNSSFHDNNNRPRLTSCGNVQNDYYLYNVPKNENHKSRNFSDSNFRYRKISAGNIPKEPSWVNYTFNDDSVEFDFDSNLALFDKSAFYSKSNSKRKTTESIGYDSSDSGGLCMSFKTTQKSGKQRSHSIGIESHDFSSHDNEQSKSLKEVKSQMFDQKESRGNKDVFTELRIMGIIPTPIDDDLVEFHNIRLNHDSQSISNTLLKDQNFLQQPDIVQEVTKSQYCNSDIHSTILSIHKPTHDFQKFSDFWKLDSDCKFPVFTLEQRNKMFECANKFGFDVRTIAQYVGKALSEFVIHQVGGVTRLNRLNTNQIPKIAVILGRCQASVFAASVANCLLNSGCYVIVYVDNSCHCTNTEVDQEIKALNSNFFNNGRNGELNFLTLDFEDLENKTFDYIISALESDSNFKAPEKELVKWCFKQKAPILSIDPPTVVHIPWKVAAFIAVPTCSYNNLSIRTTYERDNGFFKPRSDGVRGLEIDKMFKKPDGLIVLFDANLPLAVFSLLNLNYNSPFVKKNWIRLYRENELSFVE